MENTTRKSTYVLGFQEIDKTKITMVGGKAANLGELTRIDGINVPPGVCVTTEAYRESVERDREYNMLLDQLATLNADNRKDVALISQGIRAVIERLPIPEHIAAEITQHLAQLGEKNAYAVRSSATAEDLPTASFAGQQDTYLNIIGKAAILKHISRCWASLFTERAVIYRLQNGFDQRRISLAVAIQQMIFPDVAGIMFTADPITSNRKVLSIDASFGLGEALVSGIVNADNYKVRNARITDRKISAKKLAVIASAEGGTKQQEISSRIQSTSALTDEKIVELEQLGRKIEAHFGMPQDIEWCFFENEFYVVQSRPITTLYPVPEANHAANHVYMSVGHQQMMTDAMKPLGWSFFQLTAVRPMFQAGGRLFVDVTQNLTSPAGRKALIDGLAQSEPLTKDALTTIIDRGDFIKQAPADSNMQPPVRSSFEIPPQTESDPAIVANLISTNEASLEELKQGIQSKSGPALADFILEDIQRMKSMLLVPENMGVIMAAMNATSWINQKMNEWLGEKNVADILSQSVPDNITSNMGLELLNVADMIRPYPDVVAYLQQAKDDNFLEGLATLDGGQQARDAIYVYLDKYGMRCAGEIDITRPRWSEKPLTLVPLILSNVRNFETGAGKRKFDQGLKEALNKEQEILERLKELPDGMQKAEETKRMIRFIRNFSGYREYPKYSIVNRYFYYRKALLKEAERLVQANVIHDVEDIYYLTFEEVRDVIGTHQLDYQTINRRREEHKHYERLTPPRVITSDGEIITGAYKRENIPAGAIVGLAVSSGVAEGRARVILNMEDAAIEEGDILVTKFTDPGWTPLFVTLRGLVTEVGGLMTHGAVIAREYGLPAVVGVEHATSLIEDGQRIRVHGTEGYVEILA